MPRMIGVVLLVLLGFSQAHAQGGTFVAAGAGAASGGVLDSLDVPGYTVLTNADAANGTCMPPVSGNPQSILNSHGITTQNAKPAEIAALAKGIQHLQALGGPGAQASRNTQYRFMDATGASNQAVDGINIRRNGQPADENVAHLMHEMGHKVGNSGMYAKYNAAVPQSRCKVSNYCTVNTHGGGRNEEFGEVFAAFVTHPDLLLAAGEACKDAYEFMKNVVFSNASQIATCNGARALGSVASSSMFKNNELITGFPKAEPKQGSVLRSASAYCPPQGMTAVKSAGVLNDSQNILRVAEAMQQQVHAADKTSL